MTRLPAAGRQGEAPPWPLRKASKQELSVWGRLWHTPQAVAWERLGWIDVVAVYARIFVRADRAKPTRVDLAERRQLEDRLGLNPTSQAKLRWEVVDDDLAEPEEEDADVLSIRDRIKAVE